ncbi:hypothetical protein MKY48_17630 [Paenibacillus sp. FSL W8-0187]
MRSSSTEKQCRSVSLRSLGRDKPNTSRGIWVTMAVEIWIEQTVSG